MSILLHVGRLQPPRSSSISRELSRGFVRKWKEQILTESHRSSPRYQKSSGNRCGLDRRVLWTPHSLLWIT